MGPKRWSPDKPAPSNVRADAKHAAPSGPALQAAPPTPPLPVEDTRQISGRCLGRPTDQPPRKSAPSGGSRRSTPPWIGSPESRGLDPKVIAKVSLGKLEYQPRVAVIDAPDNE